MTIHVSVDSWSKTKLREVRVVAVAQWLKRLLLKHGVRRSNPTISEHFKFVNCMERTKM